MSAAVTSPSLSPQDSQACVPVLIKNKKPQKEKVSSCNFHPNTVCAVGVVY